MVRHCALCSAIITTDHSSRVLELLRHRLHFNGPINAAEMSLHVNDSLLANRALIRRLQVRMVAVPVNCMSASHKHHGLRRREHILVADGAVAIAGPLNAFMGHLHRDVHAEAARLRGMLDSEMR